MNNIIGLLSVARELLLALVVLSLIVKLVLFYKVEKEWDSVRFLHFSKIDLKMTVSKHMRVWRKRQNAMTTVFLILLLLLVVFSCFHILISG